MLEAIPTGKFKRDLKAVARRGYRLELLTETVGTLSAQRPLPEKNRDHVMSGNYIGYRECHIAPDWLLIYQVDEEKSKLYLIRTGTHSDLF